MINLSVDEGYAFDYLAILEVKTIEIKLPVSFWVFNECKRELLSEIIKKGYNEVFFHKILNSPEYQELVKINQKVFKAVDLARYGTSKDITAKEVDSLNMERFRIKKELQEKFFGSIATELKN